MENVVPSALQRLRAVDIIRMAGLPVASLGQEYCRIGAVHSTLRQGARITGVVDVPHTPVAVSTIPGGAKRDHYPVEVEIESSASWKSTCPCSSNASTLCAHAAALLYQWLAHPMNFALSFSSVSAVPSLQRGGAEPPVAAPPVQEHPSSPIAAKATRPFGAPKSAVQQRGPAPLGSILDILTQLGLSELRSMAREYEIATNGMNKQQLAEALLEALRQPEAVRRVAATLEKPQRQFLAALTLAGGSMTDDDLRGLFERFSLGQPNQFQSVLGALQGKALLFRTSLNSSPQQRIGLSGALLDVGWHVPAEVRAALRVTVPVTAFDVHGDSSDDGNGGPTLLQVEPYRLLADLLLVARALDGYRLGQDDLRDEWGDTATTSRPADSFPRSSSPPTVDGSMAIPPPSDMPSPTLLATLRTIVPRTSALLRFAVRLLRLADILHKDDGGTPNLRALSNAARLLLGPSRAEAARDLFELWLTHPSYEELFDLQEDGLRLRCRATSLTHPILRSGELEAENSEARQTLVALLAQVPLHQWVSFPAFARFVYRLNPLFLQRRQRLFSLPHWWLEQEEGRPLRPLQLNDWLHAELFYLTRLLRGPLHWWGASDVALSRDGRLLAFRLTSTAGWLFNGIAPEEEPLEHGTPPLSDLLEVVETGEVLITCSPHALPLIELMENFTEVAGVRRHRLCYRLTPKALGDALSQRQSPTPLLELLRYVVAHTARHDEPLARIVEHLEHWVASYGRVRIYTGVNILETADPLVMRELSATTSLDEQIVQVIHPTLLILKKPGAERVVEELKRRGQAPLLHDEDVYGSE